MRNWKGVLAMGLSAALVIGAAQLIPEQNTKTANAETTDSSNDNMTPPSGMPAFPAPIKLYLTFVLIPQNPSLKFLYKTFYSLKSSF